MSTVGNPDEKVKTSKTGMLQNAEGLFTFHTSILLMCVDCYNNKPTWNGTTSINFQFKLLYDVTSIIISILKVTSKLNYPPVTLTNCF